MSNKAPKKVVGQVSESLLNRFKRLRYQEQAAQGWLGDITKEQINLWDRIAEELGLNKDEKNYTLDTETGEVKEQTTFKGGNNERS